MNRTIIKNILDVEEGIIAHQVHIQHPDGSRPGTFGAGLAKQIKDKYPRACAAYLSKPWLLGSVQLVQVKQQLLIANCAAQLTYGTDKRYTNYGALALCFAELFKAQTERGLPLYLPYGMGCGYGGGDWDIVSELAWEIIPQATICKLPAQAAIDKPLKVIVAGSRGFADYQMLCRELDSFFGTLEADNFAIISGGAKGADWLGEVYAKGRGIKTIKVPPDWDRYGKSAGYRRNVEMAKIATHCIVFWDGKSKGSRHMIDIAQAYDLVLDVVHF